MQHSTDCINSHHYTKKLCCFFFALCLTISLQAQKKQANNWFFGDHYGLNFSNGDPQTDYNSSIYTYEACTTVSDKDGNLLFYTNGGGRANQAIVGQIWNKNHEVMEGGDLGFDKGGGYSAAQGAIAFKKPGTENSYCLVTVDEFESSFDSNPPTGKGCQYFEIDMDANGGLGAVTVSAQKIMETAFEYMGATIHSNCEDYWLIVPTGHYALADDPTVADSFYVFKVTENGPSNPIITPMPQGYSGIPDEYGLIKITPNGKHFTCGSILYDFDNTTGAISLNMDLLGSIGLAETEARGFSSDSRFLYQFNTSLVDSFMRLSIFQYDLNDLEFVESETLIGQTVLSEFAIVGSPQLAPDGKLYFLIQEGFFTSPTTLAVIENPNVKGLGANPNYDILTITNVPDNRFLSFGNYPDNMFKYDPVIPYDIGPGLEVACEIFDSINLFGPENMETYLWSNGSNQQNITAYEAGVYWVEFWEGCEMGVDTFEIVLTNDQFNIDLGNDTTYCQEEIVLLNPEFVPNATYNWQDGSANSSFETSNPGTYWLEVQRGHCVDKDSIVIKNNLIPEVDMGFDLVICKGEEIRIFPRTKRAFSFEWQDGSARPFFDANEKGTYTLTVHNECGSATDELELNVFQCDPCEIYLPNAFSPNNDGYNDVYEVFSTCEYFRYSLQVFDRWGNHVFGTKDINATWDGRLKGRVCPTAVYAYILKIEWLNKYGIPKSEVQTGDILLYR